MDLAALSKIFMLAETRTNVADFEILGMRIWPVLRILVMESIKNGKYVNTPEDEAEQALIIVEMRRQVRFGRRPSDSFDPYHLPLKERLLRQYINSELIWQKMSNFTEVKLWGKKIKAARRPSAEFIYMQKSIEVARSKFIEASANVGAAIKTEIETLFGCEYPKFLLFTSEAAHFHVLDGRYVSPIADSWMQELAQYGAIKKLLNSPSQRLLYVPGVSLTNPDVGQCFPSFYVRGIRAALYPDFPIAQFQSFIRLRDELRKVDPIFDFSVTKVMNYLRSKQKQAFFYELVFRELNPQKVFFVSFSGYIPMIVAASRLGIPSIDLQHGGTSAYHLYLSHYAKPPRTGYDCLPSDLWCWSEETTQGFNKWWNKCKRHRAHRVGNPWWSKEREHLHLRELPPSQLKLLEKAKSMRSVLVSLVRPPHETLPDFLVQAIKEAPKDILWIIRLHPLDRSNVDEFDKKYGAIGQLNVLDATEVPLPLLLAQTDVHLTRHSTTWKEAASLGIPTGFWDEEAACFFGRDLGWETNRLCLDTGSILDFVCSARRGEALKDFSNTIDRNLVRSLMNLRGVGRFFCFAFGMVDLFSRCISWQFEFL